MQQYKYIKGSAEDFVGAPEWATFRARNEYGDAFVSVGDDRYRYVTGNSEKDSKSQFIGLPWINGVEIVAQREPIPEWNGDGLPPVGVECEVKYRHADNAKWVQFRCVGIDCGVAFGWTGKEAATLHVENFYFRPIRTEAERKREQAVNEISEICRSSASNGHSGELIYDAIAAGKIPGIKLES